MNADSEQSPSPRDDRAAAALRENLHRRKLQSRLREAQSRCDLMQMQACATENDKNKDMQQCP